jgi:hypothetical protein
MPEIIRARDCIVFVKGDTIPVSIDDTMVTSGWAGGQGVMWKDSPLDEFLVTFADGRFAGFLVWGSDEVSDQFTAMTRQQPHYRYAVMLFGGNVMSTTTYERYTYASRLMGPLVPLVYAPNDRLYFSLRGLWTKEDEATLSGAPYAPLDYIGRVVQIPKAVNNNFLTIQTLL